MSESKFGFKAEEEDDPALSFQPVPRPRPATVLAEFDQAAQGHGFTSREKAAPRRRRRVVRQESTRFLAIRASETLFNRFVEYADRYQLTYSDALEQLLDNSQEK
jgi:macrodomain Ter protein organizer (MatP/YcbG family)